MGVVARDGAEGVMRSEPFVELASWWHSFPIDVAFTATKYVNIKLSLEGSQIMWYILELPAGSSRLPVGSQWVPEGFG